MRAPYLNNGIVEFALRVPTQVKRRGKELKALLRAIERSYLPQRLLMKEKRGFYPFAKGTWLDKYYQDEVKFYLSPNRIKKQGFFNYDVIKNVFSLHNRSKINVSGKIWNLLVFQIWAENNLQ